MIGRRIPAFAGKLPTAYTEFPGPWQPGDYCGPLFGYTGPGIPSVDYRLPNGRFGHVTSPPHSFRECPDGSLEIRNSILHTEAEHGYDWHGYLNSGNRWGLSPDSDDAPGPDTLPPTSASPPPTPTVSPAPSPAPPPTSSPSPAPPPTPTPPASPTPSPPPAHRFGGTTRVNEAGWPV